ncbi:hypothetical protein [Ideonella sp.]|uniref:hypothetical protein n=1 Tax=Ideonella sp. TaxID=1929293 RepID=UPI0035B386AA
MKRNELACAIAMAVGMSSALAGPTAATTYQCIALKSVAGLNTMAQGISPDGHVAGSLFGTDGRGDGALWFRDQLTITGEMRDGYAVNDRGDMVGARTGGGDPALLSAGIVSPLPKLSSGSALVSGIDDRQRMVGGSSNDQSNWRAVWWVDGVLAELGSLGPRSHSHAGAINRYGDIVGMSLDEDKFWIKEAVLWKRRSHQIIKLPKPTADGGAEATALNDDGLIVGYGNYPGGQADRYHALAWKNHGSVIDLGALPSGTTSGAHAVRNDGVIVGHSSIDAAATEFRATVWYAPGRKPIDLNTRLVGQGCFNEQTGDHFVLTNAQGIAEDGTIVANGQNEGATPSRLAFRLVPQ